MMYAAASFNVLSVSPFGVGIGSSKGRDQDTTQLRKLVPADWFRPALS
jgi:hypothetical protein